MSLTFLRYNVSMSVRLCWAKKRHCKVTSVNDSSQEIYYVSMGKLLFVLNAQKEAGIEISYHVRATLIVQNNLRCCNAITGYHKSYDCQRIHYIHMNYHFTSTCFNFWNYKKERSFTVCSLLKWKNIFSSFLKINTTS